MQLSTKAWYVADPIHQFVEFEKHQDMVRAVVGTREFQRLRRISQLGLASFVFPGAVHSRFSHSLGAAYLANLIVEHLKLADDQARSVVCAALLHDIGHGPFSHSFEHALRPVLRNPPTHEDWTRAIISSLLGDVLRANEVDPDVVCALVSPQPGSPRVPTMLRQIISSQLDVDRMDYLNRDAHFTGVPIGKIDVHYLIRNLCIVEHGAEQTLGLTEKGVSCYEAFAFARHVMMETVYYHKQVATFESMLEECVRLLVQSPAQGYEPALLCAVRKGFALESGQVTSALLEPYVKATEDQLWTMLDEASPRADRAGRLSRLLMERVPVQSFFVAKHKHELLEKELTASGFQQHQFRVRLLKRNLYKESSGEQVFVSNRKNQSPAHITSKSPLVSALGDHTDTRAILVVFDESAKAAILSAAKRAHCLDTGDSIPPSKPIVKIRNDDGLVATGTKLG